MEQKKMITQEVCGALEKSLSTLRHLVMSGELLLIPSDLVQKCEHRLFFLRANMEVLLKTYEVEESGFGREA